MKGAVTMMEYNALTQLVQKKNPNGPHRIRPEARIEGTGEDLTIVLSLPLRELQKARQGTGARHAVGFAMAPAEFALPDGTTFELTSPWITISAL
jgi:hypothetical protein